MLTDALMAVKARLLIRGHEWMEVECIFRKTLIDGSRASGPLMRRKMRGIWQYRKMTGDEEEEFVSRRAW